MRSWVERLGYYLRNPLPPGPGVCGVCRGPASESHVRCYPCAQHFQAAPQGTADLVVPVSYAIKGQQHAHNLAAYKGWGGSSTIQANLVALLSVFLADHGRCVVS